MEQELTAVFPGLKCGKTPGELPLNQVTYTNSRLPPSWHDGRSHLSTVGLLGRQREKGTLEFLITIFIHLQETEEHL